MRDHTQHQSCILAWVLFIQVHAFLWRKNNNSLDLFLKHVEFIGKFNNIWSNLASRENHNVVFHVIWVQVLLISLKTIDSLKPIIT
jgi:hypothetical protein